METKDNLHKPMDKEGATKDLLDIKRVLDSLGVKLFLGYGAVLGAIREKDWIDHDDDIDIVIIEKLTYKQRKEILEKLIQYCDLQ